MPASVITRFERSEEDSRYNDHAFEVQIKGKPAHGVTVRRMLDADTGKRTVIVSAMVKPDGSPALPLATLDQLARRAVDGARVQQFLKGSKVWTRTYSK